MRKIITLIVMSFMYILPVLTTPAYAASHEKTDTATTTDADTKKKVEEEEEEPECD